MTTSANHLKLELKASRQCLLLLLFIYSGPFVIVGALPWPIWAIIILECCLGYSLTRNVRRYAQLRDPQSVKTIIYAKEKEWTLITRDQRTYHATLLPNSTLFSWLIVLNFQCTKEGKKKNVLIFQDSLSPSLFRQLKVKIKRLL